MKLIFIAYNESIHEDVLQLLESSKINCFTLWKNVLGKGELSEPHLNSRIWPGTNNVMMIVEEDDKIDELIKLVRQLRIKFASEGIKAFVLPVLEVT